jgi:hypothetical protein
MEISASVLVSAISSLVWNAVQESFKETGKQSNVYNIIKFIKEKFQKKNIDGVVSNLEQNPTEANKKIFELSLESEVNADPQFAKDLWEMFPEISKSTTQVQQQISTRDIKVSGSGNIVGSNINNSGNK